MQHVNLNNGVQMPMFGLGVFRVKEENECIDAVQSALEAGYRSIDTAAIYGNEKAVGEGIRRSGVPREEIFLTTKLWNEVQRTGDPEKAFQESLENLQVDYVDLYLIHWPVKGKYMDTWPAMEKIYQSGRAKAIGVSNFQKHHLEDLRTIWQIVPVVNQIELHPYLSQKPLIEYCNGLKIVPEAWSPLGANQNGLMENETIAAIAEKYHKSPAQVILRWDIDCGVVTIPKSTNPGRIKENLDIFDFNLTKEEIQAIDRLNKDERVGADPDNFNF